MSRILSILSVLNLIGLISAFGLGVLSWSMGGRDNPSVVHYQLHFYVALLGLIFNLAVHCLVFIYFLGTGRWVKEVATAYRLPDEPLPRLTRELKRRAFPAALFAMLVPIAAAAAGMANVHGLATWAPLLHFALATATLLVNLWAVRVEYRTVVENAGVIDRVMMEVERIRAEQGLPSSTEAWEQAESHG